MTRGSFVTLDTSSVAHARASESGGEPAGGLHDYFRNKLRLTEVVQTILQQARERRDALVEGECRQLLSRLASDRFNLVVVGHFNRGKSTLMNAILGVDRLPTGVLPLTSVITSVGYGDRECVLLHKDSGGLPFEIPLNQLAEWVTEHGNPGNRKGIAVAEVQLPVELLRLGFHFVDTPGVGSVISENTRTTRAFLPEADAALFVTSFDSPLDERELELLADVLANVRQVFVVINKSDLASPEEQEAVTSFVRGRLPQRLAEKPSILFPVSALEAMRSKMEGDAHGTNESGLPQLERALIRFLRVEKSREFLLRSMDRAQQLLRKQEELVRLSDQAVTPAKSRAELISRLRQHASVLHRELHGAMNQARVRSGMALRRRLQPALIALAEDLAKTLLERAQEWLTSASAEDILEAGNVLASTIADACRELTAAWLANHGRSLVQELQPELDRIAPDVSQILQKENTIAVESASALHLDVAYTPRAWMTQIEDALMRPVLPRLEWKPGWLVFLWKLPVKPVRRFILKRLSQNLSTGLLAYVDGILKLFDQIVGDSVERVAAGLSARVDEEVDRLVKALQGDRITESAAVVAGVRRSLTALRAEVEAAPLDDLSAPRLEPHHVSYSVGDRRTGHAAATCVICQRVVAALFEHMSAKQYSLSVNAGDKGQHAMLSGFCPIHSWYYEAIASPQGICLAYPPVLEMTAARLRTLANSAASADSLADGVAELLPTSVKCSACRVVSATERASAKEIVAGLVAAETEAQGDLPPLCMVHLHAVLNAKPNGEQSRRLVWAQASVFERIAEDMRTYALKHDAVRRELVTNKERWAHRTALLRLVGHRNCGRSRP